MGSLAGCLAAIDGYIPTASDPLTKLPSQQAKLLSRGQASSIRIQLYLRVVRDVFEIRVFISSLSLLSFHKPVPTDSTAPYEQKGGHQFEICGGLHTLGYTTAKTTWGEAVMVSVATLCSLCVCVCVCV